MKKLEELSIEELRNIVHKRAQPTPLSVPDYLHVIVLFLKSVEKRDSELLKVIVPQADLFMKDIRDGNISYGLSFYDSSLEKIKIN